MHYGYGSGTTISPYLVKSKLNINLCMQEMEYIFIRANQLMLSQKTSAASKSITQYYSTYNIFVWGGTNPSPSWPHHTYVPCQYRCSPNIFHPPRTALIFTGDCWHLTGPQKYPCKSPVHFLIEIQVVGGELRGVLASVPLSEPHRSIIYRSFITAVH